MMYVYVCIQIIDYIKRHSKELVEKREGKWSAFVSEQINSPRVKNTVDVAENLSDLKLIQYITNEKIPLYCLYH